MIEALVNVSTLPYQATNFSSIEEKDFLPAVKQALELAHANLQKITDSSEAASFENSSEALELADEDLKRVGAVFFNLYSSEASEDLQKLAGELSPLFAAFSNDLYLNAALFERVAKVYNERSNLQLGGEELRLLENQYKSFVRNGASLDAKSKLRLREIDAELSKLGPQFADNVVKATYAFSLELKKKEDLAGLSEAQIEAAAAEAKKRKKEGSYIITLEAPSFLPFMKYAQSSALREKLYRAYVGRSLNDQYDNTQIIKKIVALRYERATLLGYSSHAEYVLEERMAKKIDRVTDFLDHLHKKSKPSALKELAELKDFKNSLEGNADLKPWDVAFYSEKLKKQKFDFNEEDLRPYFELEAVVEGAFKVAHKLFDINFISEDSLPVYHKDVRVYRVEDKNSEFLGLFYMDFFPRKTKKGGAWMTNYREQGLNSKGEICRPHVSICCNFTKPLEGRETLLSHQEVLTYFHEFGHSLHSLLSKGRYTSLSGTNTLWDFVELPSQLMENWTLEKEALDLFAKHNETKEKIPSELCERLKKSRQFMSGMAIFRQLSLGSLDLAWHTDKLAKDIDVETFEKETLAKFNLLERVAGSCVSTAFGHIFAGGYSAGYYSYKWAELLEADAFEAFREEGVFNKKVAQSYRENILEKGNQEDPSKLYQKFRGRDPDPEALLRKDGIV